jgi:hypothetical protein
VLTADTCNPAFASFYHDHIRKLLMVRNRKRYVAKGNYNLTRLAYIHSLYANARFIIPLRHPVNHIASLIKQDALFNKGLKGNPHARRYLAWVGHFEFGPDKRPIHTGDEALVEEIMRSWRQNNNVRAWALHWNALYRFVADQLASTSNLRNACLWVRYEDLCANSALHIDRILHHCGLSSAGFGPARSYYINQLSEPDYYKVKFNQTERRLISEICGATAARLGYPLI